MDQRIRDFEPLWNAIHFALPRPVLVRQTNEHHLLSDAALAQWFAATAEGREAIIAEHLPERRPENNADYEEFDFFPDMPAFDPLDYDDPDADDTYDLDYAAY